MSEFGHMRCAQCDGAGVVKFGTKTLQRMEIGDDGKVTRGPAAVQRYRCKDCGHAFHQGIDDGVIVDAVCDSAMRIGVAGASQHHDLDPGTVARMVSRWIETRHDEIDAAVPDVVAINPLRAGRSSLLVLTDAREDGLIDIVDGRDGLCAYAQSRDDSPSLVAIEVDAGVAAAVASAWPEATIAVPPAAAMRAVGAAALASFRALVRDGVAQGRNFRERPRLLRLGDEELSQADREELAMWSPPLRRFRAAVLLLLAQLRGASPEQFADGFSRVLSSLHAVAPDGALERLLTTWKAAMTAGVADRWLDGTWGAVDALRREVAVLKPWAGLDVLRAVLVFSVPREILPTLRPSYGAFPQRSEGRRPIDAASESLRLCSADSLAGLSSDGAV